MRNIHTLSHHELTKNEWEYLEAIGAVNGCGAENRGWLQKMILRCLTPVFFEASCKIHDFGYWKGGDEARRLECDKKFLEAILRDAEKIPRSPFVKGVYRGIAYLFYFAVRVGGGKYFTYK